MQSGNPGLDVYQQVSVYILKSNVCFLEEKHEREMLILIAEKTWPRFEVAESSDDKCASI
jgi:hypothetical protein